ncbi:MAG: pyridoxine 5'-phosphate synthase [Alphaproteobacteria bacterium]
MEQSPCSSTIIPRLGLNIDHVATLRNARGGLHPNPLRAARLAAEAGADGITVHLREDRRHIRDQDVWLLKADNILPINLEMAATEEMVGIALQVKPHAVCLVPEKRHELTTEGGLNVVGQQSLLQEVVHTLSAAGIRVSLFIDPAPAQIEAAAAVKAAVVEFHTGSFCDALAGNPRRVQLKMLQESAEKAALLGLEVHMGHGISYSTIEEVAAIPQVAELNIGHFIVGEALFSGLSEVIHSMKRLIKQARLA